MLDWSILLDEEANRIFDSLYDNVKDRWLRGIFNSCVNGYFSRN